MWKIQKQAAFTYFLGIFLREFERQYQESKFSFKNLQLSRLRTLNFITTEYCTKYLKTNNLNFFH